MKSSNQSASKRNSASTSNSKSFGSPKTPLLLRDSESSVYISAQCTHLIQIWLHINLQPSLIKVFVPQAVWSQYAFFDPAEVFGGLERNCARHECGCAIEGVRFLGFDVSALRLVSSCAFGKRELDLLLFASLLISPNWRQVITNPPSAMKTPSIPNIIAMSASMDTTRS